MSTPQLLVTTSASATSPRYSLLVAQQPAVHQHRCWSRLFGPVWARLGTLTRPTITQLLLAWELSDANWSAYRNSSSCCTSSSIARSGACSSGFCGSESISVAVNGPRPATTSPMATGDIGARAAPRAIWANEKSRRLVIQTLRLRTTRSSPSQALLIFLTASVTDSRPFNLWG